MLSQEGVAVYVQMETKITDAKEGSSTLRTASNGKLYKKNHHYYLQFKEEASTVGGEVNQIIKIDQDEQITVLRQGDVSMKQNFIKNKSTEGVYRSPFGTMMMETKTTNVEININDVDIYGTINIHYLLHMQNDFCGNYNVSIQFRRM